MAQDPYTVLGVSRQASADEIRKAFRTLAKQYHPDRNPDDPAAEEKFKAASRAFEIIGDADQRAKFDRGEIDADGNERATMGGPFGPGGAARWKQRTGGQTNFEDISDIFGDFFGQRAGGRGPRPQKGKDVRYRLSIEFIDAAMGVTKRVGLPDGRGIDVTIPQGLRDGQTLRLKGQGSPGAAGGAAGDLFVEITVKPHEFFKISGDDDLTVEVPLTLKEAVLGAKVPVPTLEGAVTIRIPPNTSSGVAFRLREKGLKNPKTAQFGDLYARTKIVLPSKPDQHLKDLLVTWEPIEEDPREALKS